MKYHVTTAGMGCKHCIARVTNALQSLGANITRMELNDFDIEYDGDTASVRRAIEDLGFEFKAIEAE